MLSTALLGLYGLSPFLPGLPQQAVPLQSKAAILIEAETGAILLARNADQKMFPASTTKIMTALLVLEECQPSEIVVAPSDIKKVRESSAHLQPGEKMSIRQTLFAILLRSANDASVAAAVHVDGSVAAFATRMTQKARQIGCTGTNFVSPNGLHDPNHYTTAHDLALIGRAAMKNPAFREIVGTTKHELIRSANQKDVLIESRNKMLGSYPGLDGIKTGYTRPAGHCFVGSAVRGEDRLISVVLNSESWSGDTKTLLDWGFATLKWKDLCQQGVILRRETAPEIQQPIDLVPSESVRFPVGALEEPKETLTWKEGLKLPIEAGAEVGVITYSCGTWKRTVTVRSNAKVDAPIGMVTAAGSAALGLALFGGYAAIRHRRNNLQFL